MVIDKSYLRKFQFHKGAIGVFLVPGKMLKYFVFQFHKGAIGVMELTETQIRKINFNSIKVRLE